MNARAVPAIYKAYPWSEGRHVGWRVREVVTSDGCYIEWPGLYSTKAAAEAAIKKI